MLPSNAALLQLAHKQGAELVLFEWAGVRDLPEMRLHRLSAEMEVIKYLILVLRLNRTEARMRLHQSILRLPLIPSLSASRLRSV